MPKVAASIILESRSITQEMTGNLLLSGTVYCMHSIQQFIKARESKNM